MNNWTFRITCENCRVIIENWHLWWFGGDWQRANSRTNGLSTVRSIECLVETEYWYRCFDSVRAVQGKFVKSTIWRRWIRGIKLLQKKRARANTHKYENLCNNRARDAYLSRCIQLFRCVRPSKPIIRFARKTKLRMTTARNSNITASLKYERE